MATLPLEKTPTMDDVLREFSKIKSVVEDAVDEGMRSALRAAEKGRNLAEDAIDDAIHDAKKAVKQNPLEAVGIMFAVGMLAGGLLTWMCSRRS
jgi:ElaB/YqjD/DUF883 family membrane-anchored ribosome-binding protein